MKAVKTINLPDWAQSEPVQHLMTLLAGDQAAPQSMFVGGCVRNAVIGGGRTDIDIATRLTPEEVIQKLSGVGVKVVPTGIEHGTVTAVIGGRSFEITTLRKDVATDGRHATVAFTDDWLEDARRRDFTMNTLLMDMAGHVYDPTGQGVPDLEARRVVFVGDPSTRITEDYLRILRFFRFYAVYGQGKPDKEALLACKVGADKIDTLSRERITQEFLKILAVPNAVEILKIMFDCNVMDNFPDKNYQSNFLQKLCDLQEWHGAVDVRARLFVLAGYKASLFEKYLRLSHAQKNFLIKLDMAVKSPFYGDEKALKKAIFYHGNELVLQGYLLILAKDGKGEDDLIEMVKSWQAPECPITGEVLLAEGYKTGPDLGQELARRQEEWLDEQF